MKIWTCGLLFVTLSFQGWGQGTVLLANLVPSGIDARVTYPDRTPVGQDFTAQLYGGPLGTPVNLLQALTPTARFYEHQGRPTGYIVPAVQLSVPGVAPGEHAAFVLRAYNGPDWESSTIRGESNLILQAGALGTDGVGSPSILFGLNAFHVYPIPEPGICTLLVFGMFLLRVGARPGWKRE